MPPLAAGRTLEHPPSRPTPNLCPRLICSFCFIFPAPAPRAGPAGTFYFNEIDCAPGLHKKCCVSGEDATGALIYCTTDGNDWKQTWSGAGQAGKAVYSLMGLEFVGANEAWACGGIIKLIPVPLLLHSTDGGQTWTQVEADADLRGNICLGFDMLSPQTGFASMINLQKQQTTVAKYGTGVSPASPCLHVLGYSRAAAGGCRGVPVRLTTVFFSATVSPRSPLPLCTNGADEAQSTAVPLRRSPRRRRRRPHPQAQRRPARPTMNSPTPAA